MYNCAGERACHLPLIGYVYPFAGHDGLTAIHRRQKIESSSATNHMMLFGRVLSSERGRFQHVETLPDEPLEPRETALWPTLALVWNLTMTDADADD